jgi:hypothetical protein
MLPNLAEIKAAFRRLPTVDTTPSVRKSKAGYRATVTTFRNGKIVRTLYGPVYADEHSARYTANFAAYEGRKAALDYRAKVIMHRIDIAVMPVLFLLLGVIGSFAF